MLLGIGPDEPVLLQLGRMVPRKGVETVVEALAVLAERHGLRPRLLVVGGESDDADPRRTPEIGRLQDVAERLGVTDQVTWVGRRDRERLKYYYAAADAFVTVPWYEPFGITPVEAMACGVPVIGSDVGGIKYSVRDGETGYLVPPRDPVALADRVAQLISSPAVAARLREAAIHRANAEFTWERVGGLVDLLYRDVLAVRPPVAAGSGITWRHA